MGTANFMSCRLLPFHSLSKVKQSAENELRSSGGLTIRAFGQYPVGWSAGGKMGRCAGLKNYHPVTKYDIELYNRILDTIVGSIERRFDRSATLYVYADLSLLHPRTFDDVQLWKNCINIC